MGLGFDDAVGAAVRRAQAEGRDDVATLPLRALALHGLRHSPAAAELLWSTSKVLGVCLADLPRHPAFGVGRQGEGVYVARALAALLDGPPLPAPRVGRALPAAVTRFAVEHGLAAVLGESAAAAVGRTLGHVGAAAIAPDRLGAPLQALMDDCIELVADVLEVEAAIAAARRAAPWPPPLLCEGPLSDERRARCLEILAALDAHGVRSADALFSGPGELHSLRLDDEGVVLDRSFPSWLSCRVRVARALKVELRGGGDVFGAGGDEHARAVAVRTLVAALHIVNEPPPRLLRHVEEWFRPRHAELLAALRRMAGADKPAGAEREERVVWVVDAHFGRARVEPYAQKRTKKGGYTKGTRVSAQSVVEGGHGAGEHDRRVARLVVARGIGDEECLRELAGHPLVFAPSRDAPWTVRSEDARVALRDRADGYGVAVIAGDLELDPAALRHTPAAIWVEERADRREIVAARVPRAILDVAGTLARVDVIPAEAKDEVHALADAVAGGGPELPLELSPSLRGDLVDADPRVFIRLALEPSAAGALPAAPPDGPGSEGAAAALVEESRTAAGFGALRVRIGHRPLMHGALLSPGEGPLEVSGLVDGRRARAVRDDAAERERALAVRDLLPLEGAAVEDEWTFVAVEPDASLALVERLQALAAERDDVVVEWKERAARLSVMGRASAGALRLGVRTVHEWLAVDGAATVGDGDDEEVLSLAAMLEAVRAGRRYVPVAPGRFVALADSLRARLRPLAAFGEGDGALEVAPSAAGALDDLAGDGARFDDSEAWRTIAERARRARAATDEPPAALLAELRPYQREGVRFLRRLAAWETGGVLADDMGLGKTVQAIALLLERAALGPQLVIAPTSVCFNWQRELERFAPSLRTVLLSDVAADARAPANAEAAAARGGRGARRAVGARAALVTGLGPGDVVVAGYALAVQSAEALLDKRFATAVFDEAQAVKNADTQRARFARDLDAAQKIALSGTPLENHLGELWSIFRVVSPGLLGSQERFKRRFAVAIERDRSLQKRQELAQTLRPFLLRRTKSEVARELPERTEIVAAVEQTPDERLLYEATRQAVLTDVAADVEGAPRDRRFRVLAGITRLRLLACHPKLVDPDSRLSSSKLQAVLRTLADLREGGHRALVFSQFVKHLELVRAALAAAGGAAPLMLHGGTPAKERAALVDAFQAGRAPVFLLSLKAGGAGLNLTAADYVLHLDPWWNPAVEDQATGRAHRIGQTQPVTVYRFVARGTIEEQMLALHGDKRDLVDSVLEGADAAGKLSVDELVALVKR